MNAEDILANTSSCNQISSEDGEDKKFVSQAVAFVIGHARNGFVSLCASVASLLKEQARLKQEVESLQNEILQLKESIKKVDIAEKSPKKKSCVALKKGSSHKFETSLSDTKASVPKVQALKLKNEKRLPFRNIKSCICSHCAEEINNLPLTVPLRLGEKVVIRGELCGVVRYIGHVESLEFPQIYIGIQLAEAVGDSDGSIDNKTYFSVPKKHGIFVPLSHVRCVIS